MEMETTEAIKKTVTVKTPCFRKSTYHFYHIIDNKRAVCVTAIPNCEGIRICNADFAYKSGYADSSEKEFKEAFIKIHSILNTVL